MVDQEAVSSKQAGLGVLKSKLLWFGATWSCLPLLLEWVVFLMAGLTWEWYIHVRIPSTFTAVDTVRITV